MPSPPAASHYIPELDGIRAISILLVLFGHFGFGFVPGIFGVTVFFFVSGYLITEQILREIHLTDHFGFLRFYIRRVLRLYPALLVMVVLSSLFLLPIGLKLSVGDVASALFYYANYRDWMPDAFDGGAVKVHPFAVLWSLAVEEHYYFVFPFLCVAAGRKRWLLATLIVALISVVSIWRVHVAGACPAWDCPPLWPEHATDTRIDSILYGALLATLLGSAAQTRTLAVLRQPLVFGTGLALVLASLVIRDEMFRDTWRFTVQGIALFLLIGGALFAPALGVVRWALSLPPMLLIGRWSYSLYLWHWVVKSAASALLPAALWAPVDAHGIPPIWWIAEVAIPLMTASLVLAAGSYYGVERPMLRIRRRFGSHADVPSPARAYASDEGRRLGRIIGGD